MDLEKRLNYLKEVSAFARITIEDERTSPMIERGYEIMGDNIMYNYGVSYKTLLTDLKPRQYQYSGLMPYQLNMNLGYDEHKIIGEIK